MSETNDNVENPETPETPPATRDDLDGVPNFNGAQLLMTILSDPDIQRVLASKKEGKPVQFADKTTSDADDANEDSDVEPEDEGLDQLDDTTKKILGIFDKKIKLRLEPLAAKVTALDNLAQGFQQQAVSTQIKTVSDKHSDFNKYRKEMAKMAREGVGQGLSIEELYLIAKARAGDLSVSEPSTHSERPTPTPRRRVGETEKKTQTPRGRRGFNTVLADTLERLDFST